MSAPGTTNITTAATEQHADLWAELTVRGCADIDAVARGADPEPSRGEMLDDVRGEVVPHLRAATHVIVGGVA